MGDSAGWPRPWRASSTGSNVEGQLAKTIIYNLNPRDNDLVATMIGNFQDGRVPGKMQYGSGWWFLDQKDGMERQLETLSNQGLLSRFVGMLTDSRSFLSYTRHEYFRRILCNLLGTEIEQGILPNDLELIGAHGPRHLLQQRRRLFRLRLAGAEGRKAGQCGPLVLASGAGTLLAPGGHAGSGGAAAAVIPARK